MTRHTLAEDVERLEDPPETPMPPRPAAIELASAILVVAGVLGLLGAGSAALDPQAAGDPFLSVTAVLALGSIVMGLLIRLGRSWILALNYVAVLGFLDLLSAGTSPLALMLGLADIVVVVILFINKPWFDAMRARRDDPGVSP